MVKGRRTRKGAGRGRKGRNAASRKKQKQRRRHQSSGDAHCTTFTEAADSIIVPPLSVPTEQQQRSEVDQQVMRVGDDPPGTFRWRDYLLPFLSTSSDDSSDQINSDDDDLDTNASSSDDETVRTNKKTVDLTVLQTIVDDSDEMQCDDYANRSHDELCNTVDTDTTKPSEWEKARSCGLLHQSTQQRRNVVSVDIIYDPLAISLSNETVITLELVMNAASLAPQDEGCCLRVEEMQVENRGLFGQQPLQMLSSENGKNVVVNISPRRDNQYTIDISERTSMRSQVCSVVKSNQRRWLLSQDGTGSLKNEYQSSVTTDAKCEDNVTHLDLTETPFLTPPEDKAPQGGEPSGLLPRSLSQKASKLRNNKRKVIAYERASPIFNDIQQQLRHYYEIGRESAGDLGRRLLERGMTRVDSEGHRDGHWLIDTTIYSVMQKILCNPQLPLFQCERYDDVDIIHLDMRSGAVLTSSEAHGHLSQNHAALIVHMDVESDTGYHYSLIIVNVAHKQVHIFDTMARWRNDHAWNLIRQSFPNINFWRRKFRLANHTGHPRQSGATCGAWTCWLAVAYAMNFRGCRSSTDQVDITKLQGGAVEFWRSVTF